jgi:MerR family transcriptional regulator, heat shock protein HspR
MTIMVNEHESQRPRQRRPMITPDSARGVYGISVAAELSGIGTQALRLYESMGLLEPERTAGGTRRYSADDIERLHRISELIQAGVNLAGIGMVLELQDANEQLADENARLTGAQRSAQDERPAG